jgi:hypothetical protein
MVKGNWERRAELAEVRRQEAKSKKQARGKVKPINGESVLKYLTKESLVLDSHNKVELWLDSENEVKVCHKWFRSEACSIKRCRFSHDCKTLLLYSDVRISENETEEGLCDGPILIQNLRNKDLGRIRFVMMNGNCIYDWMHNDVWEEFLSRSQSLKASDSNNIEYNQLEIGKIKDLSISLPNNIITQQTVSFTDNHNLSYEKYADNKHLNCEKDFFFEKTDGILLLAPKAFTFYFFPYLDNIDIGNFMTCCR